MRIFPLSNPRRLGGFGDGWSKLLSRYVRSLGITNKDTVLNSCRHGFKAALLAAQVSEYANDALTGHAVGGSVETSYGAKDMARRFGLRALADEAGNAMHPQLDLSHIQPRL